MSNKSILIVDDDRSILESLIKLLHGEGYETDSAPDGQKAVEKLLERRYDLLLLDLGMPVKDGWATLAWLGEVSLHLPVIIITGRDHQYILAKQAGADALMEKPLDVPRLLETVHELINESPEARLQRLSHHLPQFRHVPCDAARFRELQNERFTAPWPPAG